MTIAFGLSGAKAGAVVLYFDLQPVLHNAGRDADGAALRAHVRPVFDRVLDQRLNRESRDEGALGLVVDVDRDPEPLSHAQALDVEVRLDNGELFAKLHELLPCR